MPLNQHLFVAISIICFSFTLQKCDAILPTAGVDIHALNKDGTPAMDPVTFLASQASFGTYPPMENKPLTPMIPLVPDVNLNDPLLCNEADGVANYESLSISDADPEYVMLVPRGSCSFQRKALSAQRLGASAVVVYGTLASRYSVNTTARATDYKYSTADIIFPPELLEFDCSKAMGLVDMSELSFDPLPYNAAVNDPLLSGPNSPCLENSNVESCPSQKCLLTGEIHLDITDRPIHKAQACCAWDLHIWLFQDTSMTEDVRIPVFYITMGQADELFQQMSESENAGLSVSLTLYQRWHPEYNVSYVVL